MRLVFTLEIEVDEEGSSAEECYNLVEEGILEALPNSYCDENGPLFVKECTITRGG